MVRDTVDRMYLRAQNSAWFGVPLLTGYVLSGCAGSSATQRSSAPRSVRQTPEAPMDAGPPTIAQQETSNGPDGAGGAQDAQAVSLIAVVSGPPRSLPPSTPLPDGVSLTGEPTENGGAFVVIHNGGTRPVRVRAFANAQVYSDARWFSVENALISINERCADHPACVTLARGATTRAPVWPGTSCPSVQCESQTCRHNGAGVYRFVMSLCSGRSLEGAPFFLNARSD